MRAIATIIGAIATIRGKKAKWGKIGQNGRKNKMQILYAKKYTFGIHFEYTHRVNSIQYVYI